MHRTWLLPPDSLTTHALHCHLLFTPVIVLNSQGNDWAGVGEQQRPEQGMILLELRETQPEVLSPYSPLAGENTIAQISIALVLWAPLYPAKCPGLLEADDKTVPSEIPQHPGCRYAPDNENQRQYTDLNLIIHQHGRCKRASGALQYNKQGRRLCFFL